MTSSPREQLERVGAVVIARNGGPRLIDSLRSVGSLSPRVIYVDSASRDGSPAVAAALSHQVVALAEADQPNAAKARNAGFRALLAAFPAIEWVQFVDGDTTIDENWLAGAITAAEQYPKAAILCGHLTELRRDQNAFRRVLDLDWAGPVGEIKSCGGNCLMRARVFQEVGGFDPSLPGGEEANLAARLRQSSWTVRRLDLPMGVHDSGIDTLEQWWRRTERIGYWNAQAAAAVGHERTTKRRTLSAVFWAGIQPIALLAAAVLVMTGLLPIPLGLGAMVLIGVAYLAIILKIARSRRDEHARLYAVFCILAKFPQLQGQLRYWLTR